MRYRYSIGWKEKKLPDHREGKNGRSHPDRTRAITGHQRDQDVLLRTNDAVLLKSA